MRTKVLSLLALLSLAAAMPVRGADPPDAGSARATRIRTKAGIEYWQAEGRWFGKLAAPHLQDPFGVTVERILVNLEPSSRAKFRPAAALKLRRSLGADWVVLDVPPGSDPVRCLQAVESQSGVRQAQFVPLVRFFSDPNDPLFDSQWGFREDISHVTAAWDLVAGGAKVGVLDTGVDKVHPDLIVDAASDPPSGAGMGDAGHGTCVTGIVGARRGNGLGVAGVAACPLIVKTCLAVDEVAPMLAVVAQAGAKVANLSFGDWMVDPALEPALNQDVDAVVAAYDLVVCAASGNGGSGSVIAWPARNPSVMAIGAILPNGTRWACSDYFQNELDLVAPGGCGIVTTDVLNEPGYSYGNYTNGDCHVGSSPYPADADFVCGGTCPESGCFGGTSASSPFAAGVASLVRAANPSLTWSQVRDIMRSSADKVPAMNGLNYHTEYGYGRVNAQAAVLKALGYTVPEMVIGANTTWSGNIAVLHDITVAQNVMLTVQPGAHIWVATDDASQGGAFSDRVEITVAGTLNADAHAGSAVQITSMAPAPTSADWVNIAVLGSGSLLMDNCVLKHAEWGVGANTSGSITIKNTTFDSDKEAAIRVFNAGATTIETCTLHIGAGGLGILIQSLAAAVNGNTITGVATSDYGVKVERSDAVVTLDGNTISGFGNTTGFWASSGSSTLTDNVISGCYKGIAINGAGTHTIGTHNHSNEITDNSFGLSVECLGPGGCPASCNTLAVTARYNWFHHNNVSAYAKKTSHLNLGTSPKNSWGNNIIELDSLYSVWNADTCGTVSAVGNYFGTGQCPPTTTYGDVDEGSPLCSRPSLRLATETPGDLVAPTLGTALLAPNPFRPFERVRFRLERPSKTVVLVYSVSGRLMRRDDLGEKAAGDWSWTWDGRDSEGNELSRGVYYVSVKTGYDVRNRKVVLLK